MTVRRRPPPPAPARATRVTRAAGARARGRRRARGFSLIIALLMLAVIGLASAAIMRNATSGDQIANGNRLQTQASQYAQLALRFCEAQLAQPAAARQVALLPAASPAAWTAQHTWLSAGSAGAHTLVAADVAPATPPRVPPQCVLEATATANVYTVTARGYSADFKADPTAGTTRNGSTVWLQSTVYADAGPAAAPGAKLMAAAAAPSDTDAAAPAAGSASDGALAIRQRVWQQLLTPPF